MSEGYWSSEAGILYRLEGLAGAVEYGTFNNAVKTLGSIFGVNQFQMVGPLDLKTCEYCATYLNRVYRLGQFMPELPAHPHCRHWWDVYFPYKEESDRA